MSLMDNLGNLIWITKRWLSKYVLFGYDLKNQEISFSAIRKCCCQRSVRFWIILRIPENMVTSHLLLKICLDFNDWRFYIYFLKCSVCILFNPLIVSLYRFLINSQIQWRTVFFAFVGQNLLYEKPSIRSCVWCVSPVGSKGTIIYTVNCPLAYFRFGKFGKVWIGWKQVSTCGLLRSSSVVNSPLNVTLALTQGMTVHS